MAATQHAPRILVVDDSAAVRKSISACLAAAPLCAQVDTADNGAEGVKFVLQETYDCVICDLQMPILSGIDFLRQVRARFNRLELPVLLLTSRSATSSKVEGFKNGASDFITKPCERPSSSLAWRPT